MHIESLKDQQKSSFYIVKFENVVEDWKEIEKSGINRTTYLAYCKGKASEQELIDFNDAIWAEDVKAIVTILKESGIKEFTISCKFCDLIDRLAAILMQNMVSRGSSIGTKPQPKSSLKNEWKITLVKSSG